MSWPPPVLPINITDATEQETAHPDLHNKVSQAINDLVPIVAALQHRYVIGAGAANGPAGSPYPNGTVGLGTVAIPAVGVASLVIVAAAWSSAFDSGTPPTFNGDIQVVSSAAVSGASGRHDPTVAGKYVAAASFAAYPIAANIPADYHVRMSIVGLSAGCFGYVNWSTAWLQLASL